MTVLGFIQRKKHDCFQLSCLVSRVYAPKYERWFWNDGLKVPETEELLKPRKQAEKQALWRLLQRPSGLFAAPGPLSLPSIRRCWHQKSKGLYFAVPRVFLSALKSGQRHLIQGLDTIGVNLPRIHTQWHRPGCPHPGRAVGDDPAHAVCEEVWFDLSKSKDNHTVKEPTYLSKRVGDVVPGVVVYL